MPQQAEKLMVTIQYGCSETHVLMQFSMPVQLNEMTIEQAEAMRTELGKAIEMLKTRQAAAGKKPN